MKTVLAFGDSLTWGACPRTAGRHPRNARWPTAMAEGMPNIEVITEGLRGRSTVYPRPSASSEMRADLVLPALLHSHAPLDLVVILLGLNDLYENIPNYMIRNGLQRLVEIVKHHPYRLPDFRPPQVLLVAPPLVSLGANQDLDAGKLEQSKTLAAYVAEAATAGGARFFDASQLVRASPLDGFHLEAEDSRALGLAMRAPVARLLA